MSINLKNAQNQMSPVLEPSDLRHSVVKQSRKSSESQNFNSNKILEEFDSGINYGVQRSRKDSYKSRGSFDKQIASKIIEESPDVMESRRRKSSGLERETKGIFSERKKNLATSKVPSTFSKTQGHLRGKIEEPSKKVEVLYSKCMVAISGKYFNNLKNDVTLVNNDKLLHIMINILKPICTAPGVPSASLLQTAVSSVRFPLDQTGISLLIYNLLVLAYSFPILEKYILEKILTFAIKLDCDLSPIRSTQNLFPVPGNLSAGSVFQASIHSMPLTAFARPSSSNMRSSFLEKMSIFSQVPFAPDFCSEASLKLEIVLLLLTLFTKSRLQIQPDFSSFFKDPQLTPLLYRFTHKLKTAEKERILINRVKETEEHKQQTNEINALSNQMQEEKDKSQENKSIQKQVKNSILDKRSLVDLLIDLFCKKILCLKQPNLIQFFIFISVSLKTPYINKQLKQGYFKEQFFEKLILNLFGLSVHTPAKLASLNYIQGYVANSRRISSRFQFIILNYLLKLTRYYFKKGKKNIRNLISKDLTLAKFSKFSKMRRNKILMAFSNPVLVKVVLFQARILEFAVKDLQPTQHLHLTKGHEDFLRKNKK
jgi:hypothetical protein